MRWIMLDRIVECEPGKKIVAIKSFSRSDIMFMDHFPTLPIVPGVVQVEMIAQAGGKCVRMAYPNLFTPLGAIKSAKFIKSIEPGDQCFVTVEVTQIRKRYALAQGSIEVAGTRVCEAEVLYGVLEDGLGVDVPIDPVILDWAKKVQAAEALQNKTLGVQA